MPENNPFIYEKLISLENEYNTILDKHKLNKNQESTNCKKSEKNNNSKKSNDYISIIKWKSVSQKCFHQYNNNNRDNPLEHLQTDSKMQVLK